MKKIHRGQNVASYWLSEEPKEDDDVGLKVIIGTHNMLLIEEDAKGEEINAVLMDFNEFEDLQTIMEERKQDEKENKKA